MDLGISTSEINRVEEPSTSHINQNPPTLQLSPGPKEHEHDKKIVRKQMLRRRNSKLNYKYDSEPEEIDNTDSDPDFNPEVICSPAKKTLFQQCSNMVESSSLNDDSTPDKTSFPTRNKWITPERKELFSTLPKSILGMEVASRGQIKKAWEDSHVIKSRHSLQMMRIEVSKYRTKKKNISTPEKVIMLQSLEENS